MQNLKNDFEKDFFKLMNNSVFGKTMENVRNHRDIKLVTSDKRRSILASEPNYHSTKYISKDLLIMEMKKVEVKMNKPIYLGQAILDISKTLMYEFWYDYIKPMYSDKAKLCYTDTDSLVIHIKTEDFYKDIANDVERLFDTSNYDEKDSRPLLIGKNKKVIGKFKDELGGKIMTEFDKVTTFPYETNEFKVCEGEMLSKNKSFEHDEDIDTSKTEDTDISKTEDIDINKIEDIDISKTKDIDNTKTEDKDEDTDKNMLICSCLGIQSNGAVKKMVVGKEDKLSGSFGITVMYQNYVISGYVLMVNMHTQGLENFAHILERCFLLENIRQLHQKISQTHT